jgi:hypothetical protein
MPSTMPAIAGAAGTILVFAAAWMAARVLAGRRSAAIPAGADDAMVPSRDAAARRD